MRAQTSLGAVESVPIHFVRQHQHLAREGEVREAIFQIQEGWACRYRLLRDGRRQITALFLPGDYCEPQWLLGPMVRHSIVAISNVRATSIPIADLSSDAAGPEKTRAILSAVLASFDRQGDWIVSLGRKTAMERISGLLCELFERMRAVGLAYGDQCALPLTQTDLADMTGLTPVHVNRVLRELRGLRLVELQSRWLRLPDLAGLRRLATLPTPHGDPKSGSAPAPAEPGAPVIDTGSARHANASPAALLVKTRRAPAKAFTTA